MLLDTTNRKIPTCRLVWSGVECYEVEMCHGGVLGHLIIDSFEVNALGLTFIDTNI
jgi:hypothetical protein